MAFDGGSNAVGEFIIRLFFYISDAAMMLFTFRQQAS
jgi:hypothetical protein